MTKTQLSEAVQIALSPTEIREDIDIFDGFGLPRFQPITCTIRQLAALVRWQCVQFSGGIDGAALNEIADMGRGRFMVV